MPQLNANIDYLFLEAGDLAARMAAAARAGFRGVEMLRPYAMPAKALAEAAHAHGLEVVLINAPPQPDEMGNAAIPGAESAFEAEFARALEYAVALKSPRIHMLSGRADPGDAAARETLIGNLRRAAPVAAAEGVALLIEPLNGRDQPDYFLNSIEQGLEVVEAVGLANVRLQFDCYHTAVQQGDVARRMQAALPLTGHIQIAGPPHRVEPDKGEVNYPYLLGLLDAWDYDGWVGLEYRPLVDTASALAWAAGYGIRA